MDRDKIAQAMPSVRQEFEALKEMLREGRMNAATSALFGAAIAWGGQLRTIYAKDDRAALMAGDALTRFFVTRYRGMPEPPHLDDAPPAAWFLMAFTAFPYLDALMDETVIGEHVGFDEDGNWLVGRVLAGDYDGARLKVDKGPKGWRFDLLALYQDKAIALQNYIETSHGGDFDAFLWRYVADHDLVFDMDRAFRPSEIMGGSDADPRA